MATFSNRKPFDNVPLWVPTGRIWMALIGKLDWASKLNVAAICASLIFIAAIVIGAL